MRIEGGNEEEREGGSGRETDRATEGRIHRVGGGGGGKVGEGKGEDKREKARKGGQRERERERTRERGYHIQADGQIEKQTYKHTGR